MIDFPNSPTDGQIFSAPNGVVYKYSATYSSWLTGTVGSSGKLLQTVNIETGAVATGTTVMNFTDVVPVNTAGDQYMSLAITPQSATSTLLIDVVWIGGYSVIANLVAALFQDATANALAVASQFLGNASGLVTIAFRHKMTSGTTSATTFKLRVGGHTAGTTTFNGISGGRLYGGAFASSITIQEVLP